MQEYHVKSIAEEDTIKVFLGKLKKQGWTQEQIAAKVLMRQSQISTLAKGGDCKATTIIRFAEAFKVTTDQVLNFHEWESDAKVREEQQKREQEQKEQRAYKGEERRKARDTNYNGDERRNDRTKES